MEYLAFKLWDVDGQTILKIVKLDSESDRQAYIEENEGYQATDSVLIQSDKPRKK